MEWIFEGIGTAIIVAVLGGAVGGGIWFWRSSRTKVKVKQKQKAGSNTIQIQSGRDTNI